METPITVGINGFGRIGRLVTRAIFTTPNYAKQFNLVAINDPGMTAEQMVYLLTHDSVYGAFDGTVKVTANHDLEINGNRIVLHQGKHPGEIHWGGDCDFVVESSGLFCSMFQALEHRKGGAKQVIISAPTKDNTPMIVMGVNEKSYSPNQHVVSNASCTTNCLAPIAAIIDEAYGIEEGLMSTIHAMTATQSVVDGTPHGGAHKDFRAGRCASTNVIPATTGAAEAVTKVIPSLQGKMTGIAYRVPVAAVSVVDLTVRLQRPVTSKANLDNLFKTAAEGPLKDIVGYTEEAVVSSDFIGNQHSCIYDAQASILLNPHFAKIVAWYDNEWGYSLRLLDLIVHMRNTDVAHQKK